MVVENYVMGESKTISKRTFGCLTATLMIAISVVEVIAAHPGGRALGFKIQPGWIVGLGFLNLVLSHVAADKILKLFGRSRSGKVVEVRGRSLLEPDEEAWPGEVVEVHLPKGMITFLLVTTPIMALFFCAPLILGWKGDNLIRWLAFSLGIILLIGFVHVLLDYKKPQVRADAAGITGYPSHRALRRKFVPWSNVLTCEIETFFDSFGKPTLLRPILKGHNGETLMELSLVQTRMGDQERVVKYIRARLPKTVIDPWE